MEKISGKVTFGRILSSQTIEKSKEKKPKRKKEEKNLTHLVVDPIEIHNTQNKNLSFRPDFAFYQNAPPFTYLQNSVIECYQQFNSNTINESTIQCVSLLNIR